MSMATCSNACGGFTVAAGAASAAARRGSRKQAAASAIMSQPRVRQQSPRLAASSRARAGRSSVACAAAGEADLRKVDDTSLRTPMGSIAVLRAGLVPSRGFLVAERATPTINQPERTTNSPKLFVVHSLFCFRG